MDVVMLLTVITLVINLVVDLLLMAIDPRTREVGR
jgi:ABC-type dipeptide/oligopeptide/nickel transport system permease component